MKKGALFVKGVLTKVGSLVAIFLVPILAWAQPPTTVKVGIIPIATTLPLFTAMEKGFFGQQGVKLEPQVMAGGAVILPALAGGSVDVGHTAYGALVIAKDKGFDLKVIVNANTSVPVPGDDPAGYKAPDAILVAKGAKVASAKDLEGKKIAVNTLNSPVHLLAYEWMEKKGANARTVQWVEMPFPNMGAALATGVVDAIAQTEPFVTILLAGGQARNLGWYWVEVRRQFIVSGYVVMAPWLAKNRELVQRFATAYRQGMDYAMANPQERAGILVKYIRMAPDLAQKIVHYSYDTRVDVDSLQWWADLMLKHKLLGKRMDVRELIHDTAR